MPPAASRMRVGELRRRLARRGGARRERRCRRGSSRSSRTVVAFSLPPPQPERTSSSSGRAMQSSRIGAPRDHVGDVFDQVEEDGSPHWMSSKTTISGSLRSGDLERLAGGPRGLGRRRRNVDLAEHGRERAADRDVGGERRELLQDLDERPVRDALAVREAAARRTVAPATGEELVDEARLADAGVAEDREQTAAAVAHGALERARRATPARRARPTIGVALRRPCPRLRLRRRYAVSGDDLPFTSSGGSRLGVDRVTDECVRVRADQHLAGGCRLLEARRDVDRVAGRERVGAARDNLAGVHPDPGRRSRRRRGARLQRGRRVARRPRARRECRRPPSLRRR